MKLNELDLDNIADWPGPAKVLFIGALCCIILIGGYWYDTQNQLSNLNTIVQEQNQLKAHLLQKQQQGSLLSSYADQMQLMHRYFSNLLKQLPESTEVPGLVEDISKEAVMQGLELKSIKLQPEQEIDFYAELPIEIIIGGTYHQIAMFISNVASLPRIVTLHDFEIDTDESTSGKEHLTMTLTAKTYRYLGEPEEESPAATPIINHIPAPTATSASSHGKGK